MHRTDQEGSLSPGFNPAQSLLLWLSGEQTEHRALSVCLCLPMFVRVCMHMCYPAFQVNKVSLKGGRTRRWRPKGKSQSKRFDPRSQGLDDAATAKDQRKPKMSKMCAALLHLALVPWDSLWHWPSELWGRRFQVRTVVKKKIHFSSSKDWISPKLRLVWPQSPSWSSKQ